MERDIDSDDILDDGTVPQDADFARGKERADTEDGSLSPGSSATGDPTSMGEGTPPRRDG